MLLKIIATPDIVLRNNEIMWISSQKSQTQVADPNLLFFIASCIQS